MRQIWQTPISIALLTIIGLICALIGDNLWRVSAWLCIGAPMGLLLYFLFKNRLRKR